VGYDQDGTPVFAGGTGHWEINGPGLPDYNTLSFSFNPNGLLGFSLTFTLDKHYHLYVAPGLNIGVGYPASGVSSTVGWMTGQDRNVDKFLKGTSCSYGAQALFIGETHEVSSGGRGISQTWFATPQVGLSCGYAFNLF
jgi:hypothetical protein